MYKSEVKRSTRRRVSGCLVRTFRTVAALETWLRMQPIDASGVWIRLQKKHGDVLAISRQDVIDAALCHGWIDGQGLSYDSTSYLVRLTPRRPRSLWSQVNRERILWLTQQGRMTERGIEAVAAAQANGHWDAAYASAKNAQIPDDLATALEAYPEAKQRYSGLSKSAKYQVLRGLETVKKPETRARRIAAFVQQPHKRECLGCPPISTR